MLKMSESYDVLNRETPIIEKLYHSQTLSESLKSNVGDLINIDINSNVSRKKFTQNEFKKELRKFEELMQVIDYLAQSNGQNELNVTIQKNAESIISLCSTFNNMDKIPLLEYNKLEAAQNRFIRHSKNLIDFQNQRFINKSIKARKIARESTNFVLVFSIIGLVIFGLVIFSLIKLAKHLQFVNLQLREEKRKAEKANSAKTEFLSNVSHELRTPLNVVIGYSNLLLQNDPRIDQIEDIKTLRFSAKGLLMLIEDLLDITRIEQDKVELQVSAFSLKTLIRRIYNAHKVRASDKSIDLRLDIDPNIPELLHGDAVRIGQVMTNLCTNALKFTEKGFVLLKVEMLDLDGDVAHVKLSTEDSGIGIPEEKRIAIFRRFNQVDTNISREHAGVGLGLSIVKGILDKMDSKIELESKEQVGSVFSFIVKLPVVDISNLSSKKAISKVISPFHLKNKKILMVEDNQMNIVVGKKFLEKWGVMVDVAEDGIQAIDMFKTNFYDLILMDLHLPKMDGITATKEIRVLEKNTGDQIPIIALTAAGEKEIKEETLKKGMNDFISKPFDPDLLFEKISSLI